MPHPGHGIDVRSLKGQTMGSRDRMSDGFNPRTLIAANNPSHTRRRKEAGDCGILFKKNALARDLVAILTS
jgi:hypothetical protein